MRKGTSTIWPVRDYRTQIKSPSENSKTPKKDDPPADRLWEETGAKQWGTCGHCRTGEAPTRINEVEARRFRKVWIGCRRGNEVYRPFRVAQCSHRALVPGSQSPDDPIAMAGVYQDQASRIFNGVFHPLELRDVDLDATRLKQSLSTSAPYLLRPASAQLKVR